MHQLPQFQLVARYRVETVWMSKNWVLQRRISELWEQGTALSRIWAEDFPIETGNHYRLVEIRNTQNGQLLPVNLVQMVMSDLRLMAVADGRLVQTPAERHSLSTGGSLGPAQVMMLFRPLEEETPEKQRRWRIQQAVARHRSQPVTDRQVRVIQNMACRMTMIKGLRR